MERLLKKGYEVIYLTEPVDEYCIQALPEFDGKRFQNVAKEGIKFDESEKGKEKREALEKEFEPLTTWLKDKALKDKVNLSNVHYIAGTEFLYCLRLFYQFVLLFYRSRRQSFLRGWHSHPVLWLPVSMAGLETWRGSWRHRLIRQEKISPLSE